MRVGVQLASDVAKMGDGLLSWVSSLHAGGMNGMESLWSLVEDETWMS